RSETRNLVHQPAEEKSTMNDKRKPAHQIRNGRLTVTIWKVDSTKGSFYSAVPSRSYRKDNQWKDSDNFDCDDLLALAKLLDQAHTWIVNAEQSERQPSPEGFGKASQAA